MTRPEGRLRGSPADIKTGLQSTLDALKGQVEQYLEHGLDAADHAQLRARIEQLHETGAEWMATGVRAAALSLERLYLEYQSHTPQTRSQTATRLRHGMDALAQAVTHFLASGLEQLADALPTVEARPEQVVIVSNDLATSELLQIELALQMPGAQVILRSTLPEQRVDLLLLDLDSQSAPFVTLTDFLPNGVRAPQRLVCLSTQSDIATRLIAARFGAQAFIHKPVHPDELAELFNRLEQQRKHPAYRILIVDDEPDVAEYYAEILREAGMVVQMANGPVQMFEKIAQLNPELIVLDLYMLGWSGLEIASVLRQQPAYMSVPIVFLSSEHAQSKRLEAMRRGADDFLVKPIEPDFLVAAIQTRAARFRLLREQHTRDALTGMLGRQAIMQLLEVEAARCKRSRQPLGVVMLDIDGLQRVNQALGHQAGDQLLRALCALLRQRLRVSDGIGRIQGGSFLVVLPDVEQSDVLGLIDALRVRFGRTLLPGHTGATVPISFSAGATVKRVTETIPALLERAEAALREAKAAGGNRVYTQFE
ncbi:response regulator [Silvimonas sp.]|uniref:response regulator n=1 Tax=Silvimonas sp. TaxID=2650811 RepID=UPI00284DC6DD|nr:response regulator [Silvimonas sp.]MDR3427137.1 response regulator [Silvimonas sp.]